MALLCDRNTSCNVLCSVCLFVYMYVVNVHFRGQQELHTISTAIQNALSSPVAVASALKGIQKTLGKPLPFKVRGYIGNKEIVPF